MIEVRNLTKTFKLNRRQRREKGKSSIDAVSDVGFICRPGRVFTLLGPNGAGKTTTLRIIATMMRPTSGSVSVNGFDVAKQSRQVRSCLGFLTGATRLYDRLTPYEVIEYYGRLFEMEPEILKTRRDRLFEMLDITPFAKQRIGKLSTGMKQKVSIVRTIIHDPQVVVFDEPTSGLDVVTSRNIIKLIRECREEGKTVIFSTHIMGEVSMLSDDLAIIHDGRLLYSGTYSEFKDKMQARSLEDEFIRLVEEE